MATRTALAQDGVLHEPSDYDEAPYPITYRLIEGRPPAPVAAPADPDPLPIRLLHGRRDADVPWMTTARIAEKC